MKKLIFLFSGLLLSIVTVNADTKTTLDQNTVNTSYNLGYGNTFIFAVNGVEYAIFPDGQFDFHIGNRNRSNVSFSVSSNNANFSFNTGYDYNPYIQYDEFGAIIQIENTPIYYDYFGKVDQIGDVYINYNAYGYIRTVGGMRVHYNRYNRFSHCTGFINIYNRVYVPRPWHSYYRIPTREFCVVYNSPYRRNYTAVRYQYNRPFANNYRRTTSVGSRRGKTIRRNSALATRGNGLTRANHTAYTRNRSRVNSKSSPRRNTVANVKPRRNTSTTTRPRTSTPNRKSTSPKRTRATNKTRTNRSRTVSKPRTTQRSSRVAQTRPNRTVKSTRNKATQRATSNRKSSSRSRSTRR